MKPRRLLALVIAGVLLAAAGCGGGGDEGGEGGDNAITFWLNRGRRPAGQRHPDDRQPLPGAERRPGEGRRHRRGPAGHPDPVGQRRRHPARRDGPAVARLRAEPGHRRPGRPRRGQRGDREPGPRHLLGAGAQPGRGRRQADGGPQRHLDPAPGLPQGPVREGRPGDPGHLRQDPGRGDQAQAAGPGRDRRRHQGRRVLHRADLRVLRARQRLPADRRPGRDPADLAPVRGHLQVLQRPDQERLHQGRPGRRHHPRRLLRRQGGDDRVVVVPARRAGRAAQRRPADLCRVPLRQAVPVREQRRGHRHQRPRGRRADPVRRDRQLRPSSRTATSTRPSSSSSS